ncbi:hypothetical protein ScPMuIL_003089 [Solemya velum]
MSPGSPFSSMTAGNKCTDVQERYLLTSTVKLQLLEQVRHFTGGNSDEDGSFLAELAASGSNGKYSRTDDDLSSTLTITETLESDLHYYICEYGVDQAIIELTPVEIEGRVSGSGIITSHIEISNSLHDKDSPSPVVWFQFREELPNGVSIGIPYDQYDDTSFTEPYFWKADEKPVPGIYQFDIATAGTLKREGEINVPATLELIGDVFIGGETRLRCTLQKGSVQGGSVTWSTPVLETVTGNDRYEISQDPSSPEIFTLIIKSTDIEDVGEHMCQYGDQTPSYEIEADDIQALEWSVGTAGGKIKIQVFKMKPLSTSVTVLLGDDPIDGGIIDAPSLNEDTFTHSYIWLSSTEVKPGTYVCTVSNGKDLTNTYNLRISAYLQLADTYGVSGGETRLKCTLEYGTVTNNDIIWSTSTGGSTISDGEKYSISDREQDTFYLTIKRTQLSDLEQYICSYGTQSASYSMTGSSLQALEWSGGIDNSKITITISMVRPSPPKVAVTLEDGDEEGVLSGPSSNSDGLTNAYTWTSAREVPPGTYECTVGNGADMSDTFSLDVPATLTLLEGYGILYEDTILLCTLAYGTVVEDGEVTWSTSTDLSSGDDYAMSGPVGDTFKLTVKNTQPADLVQHTCVYDDGQTASFTLDLSDMEALEWDVTGEGSTIIISITKLLPPTPVILVELDGEPVDGVLSDATPNADGLTTSYTWTSTDQIPGTYRCTVGNEQHLESSYNVVLQNTLALEGSHGVLGGETVLVCTLKYGILDEEDEVTWAANGEDIDRTNTAKYGFTRRDSDTSDFLTIKDTAAGDLVEYGCSFGDQTATHTLTVDEIEALTWSIGPGEGGITVTFQKVRPHPPTVVLKLNNKDIDGSLSAATPNEDLVTYSYTWTPREKVVPGFYTCNVGNGGAMTDSKTHTVQETLGLLGTHGILGGETRLLCKFQSGTVVGDAVGWRKDGNDIAVGDKYDISPNDGDSFTLTIQDTQLTDLNLQYTCYYGDQSATHVLSADDIQVNLHKKGGKYHAASDSQSTPLPILVEEGMFHIKCPHIHINTG